MKMNILVLLLGFTFSCSTSTVISNNDLKGNFYGISAGHIPNTSIQYFLELNADNTFNLKINGHDYRPECTGKWQQKSDTIILKCNEEKDIGIVLSSGYMNQREFMIKVKNKKKLKLDKVVLNRK
ncbi:MAG TPA: hypothetical protein VF677_04295 [Flavobacterium sp.]|jgi:hypothetical protein